MENGLLTPAQQRGRQQAGLDDVEKLGWRQLFSDKSRCDSSSVEGSRNNEEEEESVKSEKRREVEGWGLAAEVCSVGADTVVSEWVSEWPRCETPTMVSQLTYY
jgi:hypothetical protein